MKFGWIKKKSNILKMATRVEEPSNEKQVLKTKVQFKICPETWQVFKIHEKNIFASWTIVYEIYKVLHW